MSGRLMTVSCFFWVEAVVGFDRAETGQFLLGITLFCGIGLIGRQRALFIFRDRAPLSGIAWRQQTDGIAVTDVASR